MKNVLLWVLILTSASGMASGFERRTDSNRPKVIAGCRQEDFRFWSVEDEDCDWTKDFYADEAKNSGVTSCNGDEFMCTVIIRCIPRYYLNTLEGCYFDNIMRIIVPCRENEFMCEKTRRCVPRWAIADNFTDCHDFEIDDDSDEARGPYEECLRDEFRCKATGRCIPREWVLDGEDDCPNEEIGSSDESNPFPACHEDTEFRCSESGRCLLRYRVMDDHPDCSDESDEMQAIPNCTQAEFRCHDTGRCIPRAWVMDSRNNCPDGSDEIPQVNVACLKSEFLCHDGRRCIPKLYQCDGMQHCEDCSDEIESCDVPSMWRCPGDPSRCFPQSNACDAFSSCPNQTDTMSFLPGFKCEIIKTEELQMSCAVPQWMLYDDLSVCSDHSDLCFAEGNFVCSRCADGKTIISNAQICDGVTDCGDLWDECLCPQDSRNSRAELLCQNVCYGNDAVPCKHCLRGQIYCKEDNICLNQEQLCDGTVNCLFSELDEKFCTKPPLKSIKLSLDEKDYKCRPLPREILMFIILAGAYAQVKPYIPDMAARCDGVLECVLFDDECNTDCPTRPVACDEIPEHKVNLNTHTDLDDLFAARTCKDFDPADIFDNLGYLSGGMICNGIKDCIGGEDEQNCTGRHECNVGKVQLPTGEKLVVSIDNSRVCDGVIDCSIDDPSDERNCSDDRHFYCYNGKPLFVSPDFVMDGNQDCDDNSDECPDSKFDNNAFSSREEMIRSPFLRYFIWIMAALALLGNFGVFLETFVFENSSKLTPMGKCNRTLILNLAASDILMGLALLMIGIKSSLVSGKYCLQDDAWRVSNLCNATGMLIAMSSETSVFNLVSLTFYRLYGVFKPFASRHMKLKKVYILILVNWLFSIILAVTPILPGIKNAAITHALTKPSLYFSSTRVTWEEMERFAMRGIVLGNVSQLQLDSLGGWEMIEDLQQIPLMKEYMPEILGYFGYYSADGVCIPRLFRIKESPPLHPLMVFIISVNFCSLVFIIISYCMIYKKSTTKASNLRKSDASESKNAAMQRKITILIGTNLCCWLPICLMSFLSQAGIPIPIEAYAVAAIVLLPINSSINPFIYSNGLQSTRHYVKKKILPGDC